MALRTVKIPVGASWGPPAGSASYELVTGANITYPTWHFDAGSTETIFCTAQVPSYYQGGNIKVRIQWITTVNTGNVRWAVSIQPKRAGSTWDAAFPTAAEAVSAAPGTAGVVAATTIDLTGVATLQAGDNVMFRIQRLGAAGTDTVAADANMVDLDWLIDVVGPQNITARVATTGNVTVAGGAPNTQDGVILVANDIILVWQQTTASQNGLYVVTTLGSGANGTWTRAHFMDENEESPSGLMVWVSEGDTMSLVHFLLVTPNPISVGVTNLKFVSGRAYVRDDLNETTITASTAFTLIGAPVKTDALEMTDYSDVSIQLAVTNNNSNTVTDIVVTAEWSNQATPTVWDTMQSDDAIAEGDVELKDYVPLRVPTATVPYRIGYNFPKRGRWMRFSVYANQTGGAFSVTALRHVRG